MFDVGFFELLVIGVVALVVLGPERLPKAARFAGLWVRKARAQWYSVKSEFERELAADEMRRSIGDPARDIREQVDGLGRELRATTTDLQAGARELGDAARLDDASPSSAAPATPARAPDAAARPGDDASHAPAPGPADAAAPQDPPAR